MRIRPIRLWLRLVISMWLIGNEYNAASRILLRAEIIITRPALRHNCNIRGLLCELGYAVGDLSAPTVRYIP